MTHISAEPPHPAVGTALARADEIQPGGRRRWSYGLLLLTVLAMGAVCQTPPGRAVLRSAHIVGAPAAYTELTFVAPADLPSKLVATSAMNVPAFEIHNVTGETRNYRWSVILGSAGHSVRSATGETSLADGQRKTLSPALNVDCRPGAVTMTVKLAGSDESIAFKADCMSSDSGQLS